MKGMIWGNTSNIANDKLETLIVEYEKMWNIKPKLYKKGRYSSFVEFENGDIWRAKGLRSIDDLRGYKFNIVLLDYTLTLDIQDFVKATLVPPIQAIGYY